MIGRSGDAPVAAPPAAGRGGGAALVSSRVLLDAPLAQEAA